jgi:hypothetical protein
MKKLLVLLFTVLFCATLIAQNEIFPNLTSVMFNNPMSMEMITDYDPYFKMSIDGKLKRIYLKDCDRIERYLSTDPFLAQTEEEYSCNGYLYSNKVITRINCSCSITFYKHQNLDFYFVVVNLNYYNDLGMLKQHNYILPNYHVTEGNVKTYTDGQYYEIKIYNESIEFGDGSDFIIFDIGSMIFN